MSSVFTGVSTMIKRANGVPDSRKIKQRIADNIERERIRLEMSRQTETDIRKSITDAVDYLSVMNNYLPKKKKFDFRIERHRHNELEQYSIIFRVGGSGKRYSQCVGFIEDVLPVLERIADKQIWSLENYPLTPRAIEDVERLLSIYGY